MKRLGRFSGRRSDWKKAFVTLKEGEKLEMYESA
jgi:large subunit ribosomal protein L23